MQQTNLDFKTYLYSFSNTLKKKGDIDLHTATGSKTEKAEKPEKKLTSHTRIGSQDYNISGGAFYVAPEKRKEFYETFYKQVYSKGDVDYLTEVQITDNYKPTKENESVEPINGPILVDFDFRYAKSITQRQHTSDHIQDMIFEYLVSYERL